MPCISFSCHQCVLNIKCHTKRQICIKFKNEKSDAEPVRNWLIVVWKSQDLLSNYPVDCSPYEINYNIKFLNYNIKFFNNNIQFLNYNIKFLNYNIQFLNYNIKFLNYNIKFQTTETVSEWLLFIANSAIVQLYHGENKLISVRWWWGPLYARPTRLVGFL